MGTPMIKITREEDQDTGSIYVEGEFVQFPGYTFQAVVDEEPNRKSETYYIRCGRVVDYSLFHNGKKILNDPEYEEFTDYDSIEDEMTTDHHVMIDQLDRHFPPSPEEREAAQKKRQATIDAIGDDLFRRLINSEHYGEPVDLVSEALQQLAKEYPDRYIKAH